MKKGYIICLLLFVGVSVYFGAYLYARMHFQSEEYYEERFLVELETETPEIEPLYEAAVNEQRICNLTRMIQEEYHIESGKRLEYSIDTPVGLLGYSRDKLIVYMKQYMKNPNREDRERGLVAFELISFSKEQVVWRKSYSLQENVEFLGKNENGYLTIYLPDGKSLYDYTSILVQELPKSLQKELEKGKVFKSKEELYDFLETYTS